MIMPKLQKTGVKPMPSATIGNMKDCLLLNGEGSAEPFERVG